MTKIQKNMKLKLIRLKIQLLLLRVTAEASMPLWLQLLWEAIFKS
jgi:hypothetical protein